jgi:hypothetical protein
MFRIRQATLAATTGLSDQRLQPPAAPQSCAAIRVSARYAKRLDVSHRQNYHRVVKENVSRSVRAYLSRLGHAGAAKRQTADGVCLTCGAPFVGLRRRLYCSDGCRVEAHRLKQRRKPATDDGSRFVSPLVSQLDAFRSRSRPLDVCVADLIRQAREDRPGNP